MERKGRTFRKLVDNIQRRYGGQKEVQTDSTSVLSWNVPDFPSVDPLPIFWPGPFGQDDDLIDAEAVPLVKDEQKMMSIRTLAERWESLGR
jgi:hypothetical protein